MGDESNAPQSSGPVRKVGSFFTTLPGILTGVAALISAIVGLMTVFGGDSDDPPPPDPFWVDQVNEACLRANDRLEAIQLKLTPSGTPDWSLFDADYSDVMNQLVEDLTQLPAPAGRELQASQIVDLFSRAGDEFFRASLNAGTAREQAAESAFDFLLRGGDIAGDLGAVACRDIPVDA